MKPLKLSAAIALAIFLSISAFVLAQQQASERDPKADELLKKMGATLKAATNVSFKAHAIVDQLSPDGQKIQYARNQTVVLHRPDKLAADVTGDNDDLKFRYDGKQATLYNPRTNSYGSVDAPDSIPDTLDMLAQKYGVVMPMADLVFPDPYEELMEHVRSSKYIGMGYVFDTKCHHLAFTEATVDWQIWLEDTEQALPRKMVITFKTQPTQPQYTAFLSDWNLSAENSDATFTFTPPAGAKKVEFATTQPSSGAGK